MWFTFTIVTLARLSSAVRIGKADLNCSVGLNAEGTAGWVPLTVTMSAAFMNQVMSVVKSDQSFVYKANSPSLYVMIYPSGDR